MSIPPLHTETLPRPSTSSLLIFNADVVFVLPDGSQFNLLTSHCYTSFDLISAVSIDRLAGAQKLEIFHLSRYLPSRSSFAWMPSFRVTTIALVFFAFICMLYRALSSIRSLKMFVAFCCVLARSVATSAYLRFVSLLPPITSSPSLSSSMFSSSTFLVILSAYRLNSVGEMLHPCLVPRPIENHSVNCPFHLTAASWLLYSPVPRYVLVFPYSTWHQKAFCDSPYRMLF